MRGLGGPQSVTSAAQPRPVLLLQLLMLALAICCASTASATADRPLHIMFHSIPLPGHINPLLAQAEEAVRRGHRATVTTAAAAEAYVRKHKHPQ